MNDVIKLISYTETIDRYGRPVRAELSREVFAEVRSIGQSEFYQAAASGLKPEVKFVIADYLDYKNEKEVEWNGTRYNVLRTYQTDLRLEITCVGINV